MSPRYILRLTQAFFKKFGVILTGGIVLGVFVFLILSLILPDNNAYHHKIGIVGRYTVDNLPNEISNKISKGLTSIDESGRPIKSLAKSWESTDSGKSWVFHLNSDEVWQDGKKVIASDVNYEFSDAQVEIIDNSTIKFKLDSVFSAFPIVVSKPIFKKGLIGNSDWKVKNLIASGDLIQKLDLVDKKKNRITYKFYPTEDRLKLGFKLGEIDMFKISNNPEPFDNWKNVKTESEILYNNFVALFLNNDDEKLKTKEYRQALAYAINKDLFGTRALGPISPNSWAYNSQVKEYNPDPDKTKDLKGNKIVISTLPNLLKIAESIKNDLINAGVECEIETVLNIPENYQVFLATVDIPNDPDQYSLWHSTQTGSNISKFKNPRIDKLLEDGRTELDSEIRKKIYLDFQRFMAEEVPAIFLHHPTSYLISRN